MIQEAIGKLVQRKDLDSAEAEAVMDEVMSGIATPAQIAGFLIALRMKGETIEEITACAKVVRKKASLIAPKRKSALIDIVGTGGDSSNSFNISTTAAFVVAGAGIPVAKHGNRSVSSKSGAADVLAALGVNITLEPKKVEQCIDEVGIGFLFAPNFHPAMKFAIGPRKELGVRTVFNILGPLANPAEAPFELMGVFDPKLVEPLAHVLGNLGCTRAMVVHGSGLDEMTPSGPTSISEFFKGKVKNYVVHPSDVGLKACSRESLSGGAPEENAKLLRAILEGRDKGPKRDVAVLNAGAAIYVAGKASTIKEGIALAQNSLDSGKALEKFNKFVQWSIK